jgi:hypothetical protein
MVVTIRVLLQPFQHSNFSGTGHGTYFPGLASSPEKFLEIDSLSFFGSLCTRMQRYEKSQYRPILTY